MVIKISVVLSLIFFSFSGLLLANKEHHIEAKKHVNLTGLAQTFSITRKSIIRNIKTYKAKLYSSPNVSNSDKAKVHVNKFINKSVAIVTKMYSWENVEHKLELAIIKTYDLNELKNINTWLRSKYGSIYIKKQHLFFKENIAILNILNQKFGKIFRKYQQELSSKLNAL